MGLKTVGQVLAHLKKDNRLVVRVRIDGAEPELKRIRVVKKFSILEHSVQIETADPRQMARAVLAEVEEELGEAQRMTAESTSLLRQNQVAPAVEKLGGVFTTWQHVHESLVRTAELLREIRSHLNQVRAAVEGRDFSTLTDLLAHKMSQSAEQWRDAIRSFRGVICV